MSGTTAAPAPPPPPPPPPPSPPPTTAVEPMSAPRSAFLFESEAEGECGPHSAPIPVSLSSSPRPSGQTKTTHIQMVPAQTRVHLSSPGAFAADDDNFDYHPTPYMVVVAALTGRVKTVRTALDLGTSPDLAHVGITLLHAASAAGHEDMVALLLSYGADPMLPRKSTQSTHPPLSIPSVPQGATPLHLAVANSHPRVVKLLLHSGARPDAEDESGTTPLDLARTAARALLSSNPPRRSVPGEDGAADASHGEKGAYCVSPFEPSSSSSSVKQTPPNSALIPYLPSSPQAPSRWSPIPAPSAPSPGTHSSGQAVMSASLGWSSSPHLMPDMRLPAACDSSAPAASRSLRACRSTPHIGSSPSSSGTERPVPPSRRVEGSGRNRRPSLPIITERNTFPVKNQSAQNLIASGDLGYDATGTEDENGSAREEWEELASHSPPSHSSPPPIMSIPWYTPVGLPATQDRSPSLPSRKGEVPAKEMDMPTPRTELPSPSSTQDSGHSPSTVSAVCGMLPIPANPLPAAAQAEAIIQRRPSEESLTQQLAALGQALQRERIASGAGSHLAPLVQQPQTMPTSRGPSWDPASGPSESPFRFARRCSAGSTGIAARRGRGSIPAPLHPSGTTPTYPPPSSSAGTASKWRGGEQLPSLFRSRAKVQPPSHSADGHTERDDPTIRVISPSTLVNSPRKASLSGPRRSTTRRSAVEAGGCSPPLLTPTLGARLSPHRPISPQSAPHSPKSTTLIPSGKEPTGLNESRPSVLILGVPGAGSMRPSLSQPGSTAHFGRGGASRLQRTSDDVHIHSPRTWSRGGLDDSFCLPGPLHGASSGPGLGLVDTRFRAGSMDALVRPLVRMPLPPLRQSESAVRLPVGRTGEVWDQVDHAGKHSLPLRSPSSYPSIRRVKSEALGVMYKMFADKK